MRSLIMEWQCSPFFPSQPLNVVACFFLIKSHGPQNWCGYTQSKCHFKPMTTFHIAQKHLWVFLLLATIIYIFQENHFVSLGVWGFKALMYLWRKVVCLFYFFHAYETHWTGMLPGCFRLCSWSLWNALKEEGCISLVPWWLDLQCKSSWILNDFFHWKFE